MTESELEYLRRRTAEELDIAESSNVLVAADAHRRLAMLYASRVAEMRQVPHVEVVEPEIVEPMAMPQMSAGPG
jgi:hypothetical protein